jgi:hypothetical protein
MCDKCGKLCDVIEEVCIDMEPYGDQRVERRTYEYWSICCRAGVEILETEDRLH